MQSAGLQTRQPSGKTLWVNIPDLGLKTCSSSQPICITKWFFLLSWCSLDWITLWFQSCSSRRCSLHCSITRHETSWCGTAGQALARSNPSISRCAQVPAHDLAEVGGRMTSLRHQPGTRLPLLHKVGGQRHSLVLGVMLVFREEREWTISWGRTSTLPRDAPSKDSADNSMCSTQLFL